jgi:D-serine deaminase-like pyridoxal phosphate-dependent protein
MERPLYKPVGTPVKQLDTPALVVDLAALEHNLETVHAFFRQHQAKLRPHVSAHRCPVLAHKQLAAGGTVGGISVTTLGEAEVFAAHGFSDIFIANEMVTPHKINLLCTLARQVGLTVAVDHAGNVQELSRAAAKHEVTLRIAVDVRTSQDRCGVSPGQAALELSRTVYQAPHLEFAGLMTAANPMRAEAPEQVAAASRQWLQLMLDTRNLLEQSGIEVPMVSIGETATYDLAENLPGITEIRAGTYALMDARHVPYLPHLQPAARVLTTITSKPEAGTAIADAGQKAIGVDTGLPLVADLPGALAQRLSAEHCRLELDAAADAEIAQGDKIWLLPSDIGTCVNLYDYMHAARAGLLEVVWPIVARGRYR